MEYRCRYRMSLLENLLGHGIHEADPSLAELDHPTLPEEDQMNDPIPPLLEHLPEEHLSTS